MEVVAALWMVKGATNKGDSRNCLLRQIVVAAMLVCCSMAAAVAVTVVDVVPHAVPVTQNRKGPPMTLTQFLPFRLRHFAGTDGPDFATIDKPVLDALWQTGNPHQAAETLRIGQPWWLWREE